MQNSRNLLTADEEFGIVLLIEKLRRFLCVVNKRFFFYETDNIYLQTILTRVKDTSFSGFLVLDT